MNHGFAQLVYKLTNDKIRYTHDTLRDKVVLNPNDKPESMSWPSWQFQLKLVAYFNQAGLCICEQRLTNVRELHHGIFSRNDVKGAPKDTQNLIHHTYNVVEICKQCHMQVNREKAIKYLVDLYGTESIVDWYNNFPLKTKIYKIEAFL